MLQENLSGMRVVKAFGREMLERIGAHYGGVEVIPSAGPAPAERFRLPDGTVFFVEASREYREKYAQYRRLNEAVMESEALPLGHRQTIRKYFESIRPQSETTPPAGEE